MVSTFGQVNTCRILATGQADNFRAAENRYVYVRHKVSVMGRIKFECCSAGVLCCGETVGVLGFESCRVKLKCDGTCWLTGGEVKGNCWMLLVASTLHTTSEHAVSSITTVDAYNSAANNRLNWRPPAYLNGLVRLAAKTKCGFSARVPWHFKRSLPHDEILQCTYRGEVKLITWIYIYIYTYTYGLYSSVDIWNEIRAGQSGIES